MKYSLLVCLCFMPQLALAAVTFSEIAWMGSESSANHEWIELYNDGSAVDVSGWTVTDGGSVAISLVGSIAAGQYAVLERTSDASAAGAAFLLYTGALSNSGATLTLRDASGAVVDRVVGGVGWQNVGGDNTTKETAQKRAGVWGTGVATPGQGPAGVLAPQTESQAVAVVDTSAPTTGVTRLAPASRSDSRRTDTPAAELQLRLDGASLVYVGDELQLSVTPQGAGSTIMNSLHYTWNFGDGVTATGAEVTHQYAYPGRYVVVVEGRYKERVAQTRVEVLVLQPELSLERQGDVLQIVNEGDREIDLGGYTVAGGSAHMFAPYTIVLPGQRLVLPATQPGSTMLHNQEGVVIAATDGVLATAPVVAQPASAVDATTAPVRPTVAAAPITSDPSRFGFATRTDVETVVPQVVTAADAAPDRAIFALADRATASNLAAAAQGDPRLPAQWPLYMLAGILLLGVVSVYMIPTIPRPHKQ